MASTNEAHPEPLIDAFDTLTRKLTGADSPTGTDVELQTTTGYAVGGGLVGFVTGGITTPDSPTYNAGELLCDPIDVVVGSPAGGFIGDGTRMLVIDRLVVIDPSYTLDVDNFEIWRGINFGTASTPAVPPYGDGTALAVSPLPITWAKTDAGNPSTPTGARYLTATGLPKIELAGGSETLHWGLVATDAITGAFLAEDPTYGQAAIALAAHLL